MRIAILIVLLGVVSSIQGFSQDPPALIADRIEFCESNFDRSLKARISEEFDKLEDHLISAGLLKDNSGESYYSVYKTIARENDLSFSSDYSSPLLDSMDSDVLSKCFYLLLTDTELQELTPRHYEASQKIYGPMSGDISMGSISQRIIDNLNEGDFDLKFYKLSSLLVFYRVASPKGIQILPDLNEDNVEYEEQISISIDDNDVIYIDSEEIDITKLRLEIIEFLGERTIGKGVQLIASRGTSYEAYIKLLDAVNEPFNHIRDLESKKEFGLNYDDLNKAQRDVIKERVPRNIIVKE